MAPAVVAAPGDVPAVLAELWQVRDLVAEFDDEAAAQLHTVYNAIIERV